MLEWIRFIFVCLLFAAGIVLLYISIFGTYRFKPSLCRIHAAAMCDTLVLLCFIAACIISAGFNVVAVKFLILLLVQWCTSPLVSHVFVKTEYLTEEIYSEENIIKIEADKEGEN